MIHFQDIYRCMDPGNRRGILSIIVYYISVPRDENEHSQENLGKQNLICIYPVLGPFKNSENNFWWSQ